MLVGCAVLLLLLLLLVLQLVEWYGCSLLLLVLKHEVVLLGHAVGGAGVADAELHRRDLEALDLACQRLVQSCSSTQGEELNVRTMSLSCK